MNNSFAKLEQQPSGSGTSTGFRPKSLAQPNQPEMRRKHTAGVNSSPKHCFSNQSSFEQSQMVVENAQQFRPSMQQLAEQLLALIKPEQQQNGSGAIDRFEQIRNTFKQMKQIVVSSADTQSKRQDSVVILHNAYEIVAHLFYLKNRCSPRENLPQYVERSLRAMRQTISHSHDQYVGPVRALENRRLQVSLCMIESLTEFIVHDTDMFGLQLDGYEKCGKLRREIGNALMNLVYQQREAKLRLCANLTFLRRVAEIITKVQFLDQFYAGLIQNVSYNAERRIALQLAICVPPLVRATISIVVGEPQKWDAQHKQRLYKILSALWNLAEDPIENKRVMCVDFPDFVPFLMRIMANDPREVQLVQAATGILKHLCDFILQYPELFNKTLGGGIIFALLRQLSSSSQDLIIDALSALAILARHPYAAQQILAEKRNIQYVEYLVHNTNEGIVRAARQLLDAVHSAVVYSQAIHLQPGMCTSMVSASGASGSNSNRYRYTTHKDVQSQFPNHFDGYVQQQQYFTLPRASSNQQKTQHNNQWYGDRFVQETPKGVLRQQTTNNANAVRHMSEQERRIAAADDGREELIVRTGAGTDVGDEAEKYESEFITEPCIEAGKDMATSVQCTRAVSPEDPTANGASPNGSLNDVRNGEEWPSVRSTLANSRRTSGVQSPTSPSDLPDSPSQCASHKPFQLEAMAMVIKKALEENADEEIASGGESAQTTGPNVSANTAETGDEAQKGNENCENTAEEDTISTGETAANNASSADFLNEIIRNYMPKPKSNTASAYPVSHAPSPYAVLNTTPILTPISTNSPGKSPVRRSEARRHTSNNYDSDRLLNESIAAVMPSPRNRGESRVLFSPRSAKMVPMNSRKMVEEANNEEDDMLLEEEQHNVVVSGELPADVASEFNAQWITLDCGGMLNKQTEQKAAITKGNNNRHELRKEPSQSSIPRPTSASGNSRWKRVAELPPKGQNSPRKPASHQPKPRQAPPLAPKPNVEKLKQSQSSKDAQGVGANKIG